MSWDLADDQDTILPISVHCAALGDSLPDPELGADAMRIIRQKVEATKNTER